MKPVWIISEGQKRHCFTWSLTRGLALAITGLLALPLHLSAIAQVSVQVKPQGQSSVEVTAKNASRANNTLILYTPEFGKTTRTNPYGVEVVAKPTKAPADASNPNAPYFEVKKQTSIWACQQTGVLTDCGNAEIPENGFVLSAAGDKRQVLLDQFKPGAVFALDESWFNRRTVKVDIVNPNMSNNALGCSFPGCRGGQQLLVYDREYGKPSTGTNEYGFEVTVRNGVVVEHEGSDSLIPQEGDIAQNFVISGHGKSRDWLITHAPIGAKIMLKPDRTELTTLVDFDTYKFQVDQKMAQRLEQRLNQRQCMAGAGGAGVTCQPDSFSRKIQEKRNEADALYAQGKESEAVKLLISTLDQVNRQMWSEFPAFPATAIKGAWHRPVERTPAEIGRTLDALKAAGLNTVFLESVFHGYTIFPSETMKAYGLPAQNPQFTGIDLLKTWIDLAHQRDMQVHVWMHTFYAGTKANNPPGPILAKYPQWANVQYSALLTPKIEDSRMAEQLTQAMTSTLTTNTPPANSLEENKVRIPSVIRKEAPKTPVSSTLEVGGYFLDPANPEVQDFLLKLTREIATRYPVDGLQLDYIRYPSAFPKDRFSYLRTTWGYTDLARGEFQAQFGQDPVDIDYKAQPELWQHWEDYKAGKVSRFVEKVHLMLDNVNASRLGADTTPTPTGSSNKPPVRLSTVIFPGMESALELKHQDWRLWAINHWVDFLAPITLTSSVKVVADDTERVLNVTDHQVPVAAGVFGAFNGNSPEHLLRQIEAARQSGAQNFAIFDTAHLTGPMLQALTASQAEKPKN